LRQQLAAASGVPPAFHKQLETCCIFPQVRRAGCVPAELRCGAMRCVALGKPDSQVEITLNPLKYKGNYSATSNNTKWNIGR